MVDNRTFPDVEFITGRTPESIFEEMVQGWEERTGRTLGRADPLRLLFGWDAMIDSQMYADFNEAAKLNLPRYTFGAYQDSIAEIFYPGLERLKATAATTTLRFTLSKESEYPTVIPVGTRVTGEGGAIFAVEETEYIPAGSLYADVTARCTEEGTAGNGYQPGTLQILMDNDAVVNLDSVRNITTSEGGSAEESDDAFYLRMRESQGAYSTAGTTAGYQYHTISASPQISAAKAVTPGPGLVDIYVMLQNGEIPGEEMLEQIQEYVGGGSIRGLTDCVTVKAPTGKSFDVDVTWYLERNSGNSYEVVAENVERAVTQYIAWQTEEIGRDINPSQLTKLLMETGAKRVEVQAPEYIKVEQTEAAVLGERKTAFGGEEDA